MMEASILYNRPIYSVYVLRKQIYLVLFDRSPEMKHIIEFSCPF